jgi:hypothetical protein
MSAFCQKCGTEYPYTSGGVVGRTATCEKCNADLHACVQCAHYDPKAYNQCHEPQAERVDDGRTRTSACFPRHPDEARGDRAVSGADPFSGSRGAGKLKSCYSNKPG